MVKRALLIGINYIDTDAQYRLNGCINDAINVENLLIDAYNYDINNIKLLRDDIYYPTDKLYPSTENIKRELNNILEISNDNDEIWIHYSGHGFYSTDNSSDETDNKDELIVSVNENGQLYAILDDELHKIFSTYNKNTNIFMVFDCCNSGTIADLKYTYRFKNNNTKTITSDNAFNNTNDYTVEKKIENSLSKLKNIHLLSGSRDDQYSYDSFNRKSQLSMGAMTSSLLHIIRKNKHEMNLFDLHKSICLDLISKGFIDQTPCLSMSNENPSFYLSKVNNDTNKIRDNFKIQYNNNNKIFMKLF
jgi:hypothetical protein